MDAAPGVAPFQPELPHDLGDYVLLEQIGQGGMGVIYKARQCCLDRYCAVKMLRPGPGPAAGPDAEAALRAEAAAAARLDHPNIVGIYEVGRADGHLFFSMEFVPGEDLTRYVRTRILDARTIAGLVRKIAAAIAYAHARGVMHHDLKPANVVIDPDGEPQITDFGLSRRIDEVHRADPTRGAGSPNYLAPEQASARFGEPGPLTDVFGIGAILYFLLTDRPPFLGVTLEDTLHAVLATEPPDPRSLRQGVSLDLATLCLKCLQKSPSRRYASVLEVVEELDRFLEDQPLRARPAGLIERGRRLCRRHPVIAGLAATVGLLVSLIAAGSSVAAYRIHEARQRAEASERLARHQLYNADMLLASAAYADGFDGQVRRLLRTHADHSGSGGSGWEWRFLHHASQGDAACVLGRHTSVVAQIVPSRDSRHVVTAETAGSLSVWSTDPPAPRVASRTLAPVGVPVFALAHHDDRLATVRRDVTGTNDILVLLALPGLEILRELPQDGRRSAGAFTPDDASLWTLDADAVMRVDLASGREITRFPIPRARRAIDYAFSPDGRWFAYARSDDRLGLLDLETGRRLESSPGQGHAPNPVWGTTINSLRFAPSGHQLATAGSDGTVRLWSIAPLTLQHTIQGHADLVSALAYAPDGSFLVSAGRDGFVLRTPLDPRGHPGTPERWRGADAVQLSAAVLPGSLAPLTAGMDGVLHRWHARPQTRVPALTNLPPGTAEASDLSDRQHFAARTAAGDLRVGRLSDGTVVASVDLDPTLSVAAAGVFPDGTLVLATLDGDGRLACRHPGNSIEQTTTLAWRPTSRRAAQLAFSSDARCLVAADIVHGVEVLETRTLRSRLRLEARTEQIRFSPSARWLALSEVGGRIRVVDLDHPDAAPRELHHVQVSGLAFAPGEDRLASVAFDGSVLLWDLAAGNPPVRLESGNTHLAAATWAEDGTRLFVGSLGGTLTVWDLETRRETFVLRLHAQPVTDIAWRADASLVTFAPDAIRTWPAPRLPFRVPFP